MMDMMVDDMPDTAEIFPDLPDSPENGSGQIRTDHGIRVFSGDPDAGKSDAHLTVFQKLRETSKTEYR